MKIRALALLGLLLYEGGAQGNFTSVDSAEDAAQVFGKILLADRLPDRTMTHVISSTSFFTSLARAEAHTLGGYIAQMDMADRTDALARFFKAGPGTTVIVVSGIESDFPALVRLCKHLEERGIINQKFEIQQPDTTIVFAGSMIANGIGDWRTGGAKGGLHPLETLSLLVSFPELNAWSSFLDKVYLDKKNVFYVDGPGEKNILSSGSFLKTIQKFGGAVWQRTGRDTLQSFLAFLPHVVLEAQKRLLISSYPPWSREMKADLSLWLPDSWDLEAKIEEDEEVVSVTGKMEEADTSEESNQGPPRSAKKGHIFRSYVASLVDDCPRYDIGSDVLYRSTNYKQKPVWLVCSKPTRSPSGIWGHLGYVEIVFADESGESTIQAHEYKGQAFVPGVKCNLHTGALLERETKESLKPVIPKTSLVTVSTKLTGGEDMTRNERRIAIISEYLTIIEERLNQIESHWPRLQEAAQAAGLERVPEFKGTLFAQPVLAKLLDSAAAMTHEALVQAYEAVVTNFNILVDDYERLCSQLKLLGVRGIDQIVSEKPEHELTIGATWDITKDAHLLDGTVSAGIALAITAAKRTGKLKQPLRLVYLDDAGDSLAASNNLEKLIQDYRADLLLGVSELDLAPAVMHTVSEYKTPAVAPVSGANELYQAENNTVVNLRVSYQDEARTLVSYLLDERPIQRLVLIYERGKTYSTEAIAGAKKAIEAYQAEHKEHDGLEVKIIERNDKGLVSGLETFDPEGIIFLTSGKTLAKLLPIIGLDLLHEKLIAATTHASDLRTRQILRDQGLKVVFSHVVPSYQGTEDIFIRYRSDCVEHNVKPSQASFYGYISALLVIEQMPKLAGEKQPKLVAALEKVDDSDWHGLRLSFDPKQRRLLDRIWIELPESKKPWIKRAV